MWGVLLPDHVWGFKIFLLRSLTCSRKINNKKKTGYLLPH